MLLYSIIQSKNRGHLNSETKSPFKKQTTLQEMLMVQSTYFSEELNILEIQATEKPMNQIV